MFQSGSLQDRLNEYECVSKKAKKMGKLFGGVSAAFVVLIGLAALFAGSESTVGALVGVAAVAVIDYFVCYQIGKCYPWSYYWLSGKFEVPVPLIGTMFLGFYLGLALRIKYHGFEKKIKAMNN